MEPMISASTGGGLPGNHGGRDRSLGDKHPLAHAAAEHVGGDEPLAAALGLHLEEGPVISTPLARARSLASGVSTARGPSTSRWPARAASRTTFSVTAPRSIRRAGGSAEPFTAVWPLVPCAPGSAEDTDIEGQAVNRRGLWGLRALRVLGDGQPESLPASAQILAGLRVQVQQPGHESRQLLVRRKVNRFGDRKTFRRHVGSLPAGPPHPAAIELCPNGSWCLLPARACPGLAGRPAGWTRPGMRVPGRPAPARASVR